MALLSVVYASAPTDELIIQSLEIIIPGVETTRICNGFTDYSLGIDGVLVPFEPGGLTVSLPAKNTTGQQTLAFGFSGVNGRAQRNVDAALAANVIVIMNYREYLLSDLMNPAHRPYRMELSGGSFEFDTVSFEGSYYDLLNTRWPRFRYTTETAPGLRYMP